MIYVCSEKDFLKNKKKLAKPADYIIVNCVEDVNSPMSSLAAQSSQMLKVPKSLDASTKEAELVLGISTSKKDDAFDVFINECIADLVSYWGIMVCKPNFNVFIVMDNKPYKKTASKIIKRLNKFAKIDNAVESLIEYLNAYKKSIKKKSENEKKLSYVAKKKKKLKKLLNRYEGLKSEGNIKIVYDLNDFMDGKSVDVKKIKKNKISKDIYEDYSEILVKYVDIYNDLVRNIGSDHLDRLPF